MVRHLADLGIAPDITARLVNGDAVTERQGRVRAGRPRSDSLAAALPTREDDLVRNGGRFALVGPTGVGKTTTIAKLAARYAMMHNDRDSMAFVTTDGYRIAAREQLETFGKILNVPVYSVTGGDKLAVRAAQPGGHQAGARSTPPAWDSATCVSRSNLNCLVTGGRRKSRCC